MRKIIRLLLALILGFVAFEIVDLWPVRPMWNKPCSKMAIVGFSPDEQFIFVLEGMLRRRKYELGSVVSFVKFEVSTGAEIQRTALSIPTNIDYLDVSVSADCSKLLFYGAKDGAPHYCCYLLDSRTGQCIGGPWQCGDFREVLLSPDGRWICHPGLQLSNPSLTVISSENGRAVFSSAIMGTRFGNVYRFLQDGSKLAALTYEHPTFKLKIICVPSGEVLNSFEIPTLPDESIVRLSDWSDNIISLSLSDEERFASPRIQSFRIENAKLIPLDREPLLQIENLDAGYFINLWMQPAIIVHARTGKAAWPEYQIRIAELCDEYLGTNWSKNFDGKITFRVFDRRTSKFRLDITVDNIIDAGFSKAGRYFASYAGATDLLDVWDVDPFPRWPWALAAALLALLLVYFFPSLKRRSKIQGHAMQSPNLA